MCSHTSLYRALFPLVLSLGLCFVACSDDTSEDPPSTTTGTSQTSTTSQTTGSTTSDTSTTSSTSDTSTTSTSSTGEESKPLGCSGDASAQIQTDENGAGTLVIDRDTDSTLAGFVMRSDPGSVPGGSEIGVLCQDATEDSFVGEGYTALSPILSLQGAGGIRPEIIKVRLPFNRDLLPEGTRENAIRVFLRTPDGRVVAPILTDMQEDLEAGTVTFETHVLGEYQIGVDARTGETYERRFTFRAVGGVSMGAAGASLVAFQHPERFDAVGALGGPTDWQYLTSYIHNGGMGGFCPEADPSDPSTWSCDTWSPTEELEHGQTFDNWYSPTGEGSGGTFGRSSYLSIFKDLSYAFGNTGSYNPDHPYLGAGVDPAELARPEWERCPQGGQVIESGFYDDEYNPEGVLPVIAFCDGQATRDTTIEFDRYCDRNNDGLPDGPNNGYYPGPEGQNKPVDIVLAVDYNGNGMRDRGEPIIRNFWEPYEDTGTDGVASFDEEGFDPETNPDPAGDDYHWRYNPLGTENYAVYDAGEPYEDVGLDGVANTPQLDAGGWDWGEGNGQFDTTPALQNMFAQNPRHILRGLSPEARGEMLDNLLVYTDGGVRDLFNFAVASNQLVGTMQGLGSNVRVYDGFKEWARVPSDTDLDMLDVDFAAIGDHIHVRYGDPKAAPEDICDGDGKHVGTIFQIAQRLLAMFGVITNAFPDQNLERLPSPYPSPGGTYRFYSEALGRPAKYTIALPPGYEASQCSDGIDNDGDGLRDGDDPDCTGADDTSESSDRARIPRCSDGINNDNDRDGLIDFPDDPDCESPEDDSEYDRLEGETFPVFYVMHGYGQGPEDLQASILALSGYMAGGAWPKTILVFPDGSCSRNTVFQCNDGIDNDGDGLLDLEDPDCTNPNHTNEADRSTPLPLCDDGVDNDQDSFVDLAEDRGCLAQDFNSEQDCERGTFYSNHAAWPNGDAPGPAYMDSILDLMDHIDANYRTRPPETLTVTR